MKEAINTNAPYPRGNKVDIKIFVYSYHAGDKLTRQSRTGYIIFLNNDPIDWLSKGKKTIETSVFGAEFVTIKIRIETLQGLQYKLRIMTVPIL